MRTFFLLGVFLYLCRSPQSFAQGSPSSPPLAATTVNEQALLDYYSAINQGRIEVIDTLFSENFEVDAGLPGTRKGRAGFKEFLGLLRTAFPDMKVETVEFVTQDNTTVCRTVFTGTHRAKFFNLRPTHKSAIVRGMDEWKFKDGKIVELHSNFDSLSLLVQLGLVPEVK